MVSVVGTSAANSYDLKQPATTANRCCTEMRDAACAGDEPVLPAVLLPSESTLAQAGDFALAQRVRQYRPQGGGRWMSKSSSRGLLSLQSGSG